MIEGPPAGEMFQSHAGSIEAQGVHPDVDDADLFQSHAGSIEAVRKGRGPDGPCGGFNPTLVRLRLSIPYKVSNDSVIVSIPRWFD